MNSKREAYRSANSADAAAVLSLLGVPRTRQARKYGCIACESSDALHAWPKGGAKCFSCGHRWSNVDLVIALRECSAWEALAILASAFGLEIDRSGSALFVPHSFSGARSRDSLRHIAQPPRLPPSQEDAASGAVRLSDLRDAGLVPCLPSSVYRALLDVVSLGPLARDYLAGRAIDPSIARDRFGFASIESVAAFDAIARALSESFLINELSLAGLSACDMSTGEVEVGKLRLAYRRGVPCLLIPYQAGDEILALRFRSLNAKVQPKYRSLSGAPPLQDPFNVDALSNCVGGELHVTEGELDALTLSVRGKFAVGLPGATQATVMLGRLADRVGNVARLVVWSDADKAGEHAAKQLIGAVVRRHGAQWVRDHVRQRKVRGTAKDVNDLAVQGAI